jgi:acyl-CoA reductase-like NAD-dependent aldehyde dehydrogenase
MIDPGGGDGGYTRLFIGGRWRDGAEGGRVAVENPATGEIFAEVAAGTPADAAVMSWSTAGEHELVRGRQAHQVSSPGRATPGP